MRLYEWGIAEVDSAHESRTVGVTDQEDRARDRVLEALTELPDGIAARGWVTVVYYTSANNGSYLRHWSPVQASRDASGLVQWTTTGDDD
jgi:hypothetical protein